MKKEDMYRELLTHITDRLKDKHVLKQLGADEHRIEKLLRERHFRDSLKEMVTHEEVTCAEVLDAVKNIITEFSPEPEGGWLPFLFADGKNVLYPQNFPEVMEPQYLRGKIFYLETLRVCIEAERDFHGFVMTKHYALATFEECKGSPTRKEYENFLDFCRDTYLLEFMRIAAEVTPFNTGGHVAGVHNVAMHMARELKQCGLPVDLALMSGAAIGHDIGKFGCKDTESRRVPYLHYYYTDLLFKRFEMPTIGYIGANHSTWDLELENLSLESLLLIYADFRVKSTRENGKEIIHCYSLKDSFDVILGKLDNVDDAKRKRYVKVYSKLKDFEEFMVRQGAHPAMDKTVPEPQPETNTALLGGKELISVYKDVAIYHNINLMNILSHESSFTAILESARSERDWKHTRTYLNIIREYITYLSQRQKLLAISFLYELLMHKESDIRNEAAVIMGEIIVGYDTEYRKEIPEGMMAFLQVSSSVEQFRKYVKMILEPDHKLTEQHRMWLGYKLETLVGSILSNCKPSRRSEYLEVLLEEYLNTERDRFTAFIMVETAERMPMADVSLEKLDVLISFADYYSDTEDVELATTILLFANRLLDEEAFKNEKRVRDFAEHAAENIHNSQAVSIVFLKEIIRVKLGRKELRDIQLAKNTEKYINEAFMQNLKAATPWIAKLVNIHFLFYVTAAGRNTQPLHTTTHLVNLITGSECGDVRHLAGRTLVDMMDYLSLEQRNEVAMELLKGLELGESEYTKNIPKYLGGMLVKLRPEELEEVLDRLRELVITAPDATACVALDTVGYLIQNYNYYKQRYPDNTNHNARMHRLVGTLLRGMAHFHSMITQEACYVMGDFIFGQNVLPLKEKERIFHYMGKKALHIMHEEDEDSLSFLINTASMNHVYRFISEYLLECGDIVFMEGRGAAFFPGSFDPFSLSHKGIVDEIRKLGYTVYLAIDEFSWSKRTQAPLVRRKIAQMSCAEDTQVFMFPMEVPVNIANAANLAELRAMFPGKEVYIVVGSDVVINASAYKADPSENSIHTFSHIIFRRHGEEYDIEGKDILTGAHGISGEVVDLTLPLQLEDISSTRIRENIDLNRDISHLIDPMAQNYVYENNLYLREPQYKEVLAVRSIDCQVLDDDAVTDSIWRELEKTVLRNKTDTDLIRRNMHRNRLSLAVLRDNERGGVPIAMAAAGMIHTTDLMEEFNDLEMVMNIRNHAWGKMMVIKGIYGFRQENGYDYVQIVLTELLAHALAKDYTYCLYHGRPEMQERRKPVEEALTRQGFVRLSEKGAKDTVMAVDMHKPIVLNKNIESVIKEPLKSNPRVLGVIDEAHRRLQKALTKLEPGQLVLSFEAAVMYYKLVEKITQLNSVPEYVTYPRTLGRKMCVPFGKALRGNITPNTVTKALRTERVFNENMRGFSIEEFPGNAPITTQLQMIKSFDRDVIFVDDLLHKGYRINKITPLLKEAGLNIDKILTGIMTANGRDNIMSRGFEADCAYYIPNIRSWFVESTLYPFIGGDSVRTKGKKTAGLITSVNLIMPYVTPAFLASENVSAVYRLSMTCLENARNILKVLEEEYQKEFERNLTLDRLGEVIQVPTCPDKGRYMTYDVNVPASVYVENDIQQLGRLEYFTRMRT